MLEEKRIRVFKETAKSLNGAVDHVSKGWIPPNPALVSQIQRKIASKEYSSGSAILQDLKADFGLLTHCLRSISKVARDITPDPNPIKVLRNLTIEDFAKMICVPIDEISPHSLRDMGKAHAQRMRQTIASKVAADTIAIKLDADAELISSCASLRQLGMNLIAWNYPRIYSRALANARAGQGDLDSHLVKIMGFSPASLGLRVMREWNLHPSFFECLKTQPDTRSLSTEGETAIKVCSLSEAFARSTDPKQFPAAASEWKKVAREITEYLGPKGVTIIRDRLEDECEKLATAAPGLLDPDETAGHDPIAAATEFIETIFKKNSYIKSCKPELQERFRGVYELMSGAELSTEALDSLVRDLVPAAGFVKGCLYFLESDNSILSPMITIGDNGRRAYRAINCAAPEGARDPAVKALYSRIPVKEEGFLFDGERVTYIAGVIGNEEKAGVLYLEVSKRLLESGVYEPVLVFKAVAQCFADCFALP